MPGWILAVVILLGLRYWIGLPLWIAVGAFSLWVIKDLVFYPLLRKAYESSPKTGADQLVGLQGVAQEQIDPRGYIHVRGELWRAETESSDKPISAGSPVRVVRANGMTLIVTTEGTASTGSG